MAPGQELIYIRSYVNENTKFMSALRAAIESRLGEIERYYKQRPVLCIISASSTWIQPVKIKSILM